MLTRLHYWTGTLGLVAFLLTGQYMLHVHDQLQGMADGPRMLYRSAHIYLLLTSIANLLIGVYFTQAQSRLKPILQYILSAILLLSPVIMLVGFFIDPLQSDLHRPLTGYGLYGLFAAGVLLVVTGLRRRH